MWGVGFTTCSKRALPVFGLGATIHTIYLSPKFKKNNEKEGAVWCACGGG